MCLVYLKRCKQSLLYAVSFFTGLNWNSPSFSLTHYQMRCVNNMEMNRDLIEKGECSGEPQGTPEPTSRELIDSEAVKEPIATTIGINMRYYNKNCTINTIEMSVRIKYV